MKFHLYIFGQLLTAFLFASLGMLFIAMPGLAVGAVHKLGSAGMLSVLKYLPLAMGVFVPYVLPVALLLALVSTYGRLAAQNEWTAIRMAGVNPYRMLLPALVLAGAAGAGVFAMNAELLPRIKVREKTMRYELVRDAIKNFSPGKTKIDGDGFYLNAAKRDGEDPNIFYDCYIELQLEEEGKQNKSFFADAVKFAVGETDMLVYLYEARGTAKDNEWNVSYPAFKVDLEKLMAKDEGKVYKSPRYKTSRGLLEILAGDELSESTRWHFLYAWHQRIANAAMCLVFVLVGVSTGVMMRRGTQLGALAVAVGYALLYWVVSMRLGKQLVLNGAVEPWVGAWVPLLLFAIVGLLLTRRAFSE